ncbi:MAG TPA: amidohydrolase family protein [Tepidisphaeraceae bacterium]|jgi:predicted TIM-barrel fold metal-dependent hydrolase|nr:amidohydrolase family protein [Tepidisphaeraceae bacterium]
MRIIDAYAHVSLPRFMSAEELLWVMDENEVDGAIISGAETCPDVMELSRAIVTWPNKFRAVGMPLGRDDQDVRDAVRAQMEAGFMGIRMPAAVVAQRPELLEIIGAAEGAPFVMGPDVFGPAAILLCRFLEKYPKCYVCAPHFAGIASVDVFEDMGEARCLLDHPNFIIGFSRQGAHEPSIMGSLAAFLAWRVGWSRLVWGSEYPVCLWRDENYEWALRWIDRMKLTPTDAQRKGFYHENARRCFFGPREARPLSAKWNLMPFRQRAPVWLFPRSTLELSEEVHRTLLLNYLSRGGEGHKSYRDFIGGLLVDAARRLEG